MPNTDSLIKAQFQVPASEVEAGLNGRLLLTATINAVSSDAIKFLQNIQENVLNLEQNITNTTGNFEGELGAALGYRLEVTNVAATSFTLGAAQRGGLVRMTASSANEIIVPPESTQDFIIGTVINVRQAGSGTTTITPGTGVTINTPGGLALSGTDFGAALVKVGADEWDFVLSFKGVPLSDVSTFVDDSEQAINDLTSRLDNVEATANGASNGISDFQNELDSRLQAVENKINNAEGLAQDAKDKANQVDIDVPANVQDLLDAERIKLFGSLTIDTNASNFPGNVGGDIGSIITPILGSISDIENKNSNQDNAISNLSGNSVALPSFPNSLFDTGYQEFPGGFIIQWVTQPTGTMSNFSEFQITYPKPFPNNVIGVFPGIFEWDDDPKENHGFSFSNITNTSARVQNKFKEISNFQSDIVFIIIGF